MNVINIDSDNYWQETKIVMKITVTTEKGKFPWFVNIVQLNKGNFTIVKASPEQPYFHLYYKHSKNDIAKMKKQVIQKVNQRLLNKKL